MLVNDRFKEKSIKERKRFLRTLELNFLNVKLRKSDRTTRNMG
jgi:hypothetical protein